MKKIIKTAALSAISASLINVVSVFADDCSNLSGAPDEVIRAAGCSSGSSDSFSNLITSILNGIIAVIGIVAVIYIIIGGVQYMTSAGDPGKASKARQTILYACIGLIICALSFTIVNFVISKI